MRPSQKLYELAKNKIRDCFLSYFEIFFKSNYKQLETNLEL